MRSAVTKVGWGILWYLREATGEAKWYGYLEDCRRQDLIPMSRRKFERHLADHREHNPQTRCC